MKKRLISILVLLCLLSGITVYSHELFKAGMVVTTDNPYHRDLTEWQTPYMNWHNLTTEDKERYIKTFAYVVGDILGVKPPEIRFKYLGYDISGQTYLDGSAIEIDTEILNNQFSAFTVVAHEMRHVWQMEYATYVFSDYVNWNADYDRYMKQSSEVDANIFSAMVFEMIFPDVLIEVNEQGHMKRIDTEIQYYLK